MYDRLLLSRVQAHVTVRKQSNKYGGLVGDRRMERAIAIGLLVVVAVVVLAVPESRHLVVHASHVLIRLVEVVLTH